MKKILGISVVILSGFIWMFLSCNSKRRNEMKVEKAKDSMEIFDKSKFDIVKDSMNNLMGTLAKPDNIN